MPPIALNGTSAQRPPQGHLSDDGIDLLRLHFQQDGYVVLPGIVPRDELAALTSRLQQAYEQARQTGGLFIGGGNISGHLNCFPGPDSRFVYEALRDRGVINFIREIFPKAVGTPNIGCNFNLPNSVMQHYHVDRDFTKEFIIANIAAVDTVVENGAMEVAPGTHRKFYKYWRFVLERPHRASRRVPLCQGDVLIRTSNLWHRGMPNRTAIPRAMLAYTWEDGGNFKADPFDGHPDAITFWPNWFRPTALGRLRERTFVTAPFTYATYRFARSLIGRKGY